MGAPSSTSNIRHDATSGYFWGTYCPWSEFSAFCFIPCIFRRLTTMGCYLDWWQWGGVGPLEIFCPDAPVPWSVWNVLCRSWCWRIFRKSRCRASLAMVPSCRVSTIFPSSRSSWLEASWTLGFWGALDWSNAKRNPDEIPVSASLESAFLWSCKDRRSADASYLVQLSWGLSIFLL